MERFSHALVSPYPKADLARRFCAVAVDSLLVAAACFLYRESVIYVMGGAAYLLLRDSVAGRSVGKFCFGLVVIDLHSRLPCGRAASVKRNAMLLLPGANAA